MEKHDLLIRLDCSGRVPTSCYVLADILVPAKDKDQESENASFNVAGLLFIL